MIKKKWFHNSKKVVIDWITFDSKVEWDYYLYVKMLYSNWTILNYELQPNYILQDRFEKDWVKYTCVKYIADFYIEFYTRHKIVVDIKWLATETSKLKRKMFNFKYRDIELHWVQRYKNERVEYDENQKRIRNNKKDLKK